MLLVAPMATCFGPSHGLSTTSSAWMRWVPGPVRSAIRCSSWTWTPFAHRLWSRSTRAITPWPRLRHLLRRHGGSSRWSSSQQRRCLQLPWRNWGTAWPSSISHLRVMDMDCMGHEGSCVGFFLALFGCQCGLWKRLGGYTNWYLQVFCSSCCLAFESPFIKYCMGAMVSACFNIVHTCSYIFLPHCSPKRALNIIYIYIHTWVYHGISTRMVWIIADHGRCWYRCRSQLISKPEEGSKRAAYCAGEPDVVSHGQTSAPHPKLSAWCWPNQHKHSPWATKGHEWWGGLARWIAFGAAVSCCGSFARWQPVGRRTTLPVENDLLVPQYGDDMPKSVSQHGFHHSWDAIFAFVSQTAPDVQAKYISEILSRTPP